MRTTLFTCVLAAFLAACAVPVALDPTEVSTSSEAPSEVASLVEDFGQRLQLVSLLAPDATEQIRSEYADFVAPALLDTWAAAPQSAPGRLTSSPWPDHIEIQTVAAGSQGGFVVEAEIVEMTSSGESGRLPVVIVVEQFGSAWLITSYRAGNYP
jgi:hypothetical protein